MLLVGLEDLLGVLAGEKGDTKGMKIEDTNEKGSILAQGRGHPRHIDQYLMFPNTSIVIGGIRS